jgi:VTC domain-containing protein
MHRSLAPLLEQFAPIGLDEVRATAALDDRMDIKYIVSRAQLGELARRLLPTHRVLELDGLRGFGYRSTYFDTADLVTYREHVQGRRRRFKCRSREYVDSGLRAFEVKLKEGCGRTVKHRTELGEGPLDHLDGPQVEFLRMRLREAYARELGAELAPTLSMSFTRITLVDPDRCERLTCDLRLGFTAPDGSGGALAPDAAIVESKSRSGSATPDRELRALGVRPIAGCSKYCIGVGLTYPRVKRNLSLPLLRRYFHTGGTAHACAVATV